MLVTYYATVFAVLGALAAVVVTRRRARLDALGVVLWAVVVLATTVVAVGVGRVVVDLNAFGAMNVVFRQLVVGLPLAAAVMTVGAVRGGWRANVTWPGTLAVVGALLLAPVGMYMTLVEPNRLVVHHANLPVAAVPAGEVLTIGVITDLQTTAPGGALEQRAVDTLMAAHPDVILFPGDLFQDTGQAFTEQLPALRLLLARLHAPSGVYLVGGDVDTRERLTAATQGTSIRYLSNEVVTTEVRGTTLVIGGIDLDYTSPAARAIADQLEGRPGDSEVRILLAHRPDAVALLPAVGTRTTLVVAGHTHGGQVVLPFFGPPYTLTQVPRAVAAGGLHRMGERTIFVGTGVGVERNQAPRIRLLDPPSIALLTLTPAGS